MATIQGMKQWMKHPMAAVRMILFIMAILSNIGAAGTAAAQTMNWTEIEINENDRPPVRSFPGMCYDAARGVIVLHGGRYRDTLDGIQKSLNDTWEFDGASWKQVSTSGPSRTGFQMAYDENRGVCVLYSGYEVNDSWTVKADAWEWNGEQWRLASETSKEPGQAHGLTYDPVRQKVVRHGGGTPEDPARYSTTYEWDGNEWTEITQDGPPGYTGLYFDTRLQKVMAITSSYSTVLGFEGELWELDGNQWVRNTQYLLDMEIPWGQSYAFDSARNVLVTFGGERDVSLGYFTNYWEDRTMEWDGEMFTDVVVDDAPGERSGAVMVYDPTRRQMILFGGVDLLGVYLNETWQYKDTSSGIEDGLWMMY
ncbi:MAG: hypothetical protein JXR73_04240 [Candidatus Omnitrophica bacterium]|nr:hypothetical protein [Candidatus Omnitrophota bacterium]